MAHVVPKREPCNKCNNPVFFAERLVINEKLYHRTCFRCARCSSVLTLGNFYETENDLEYCCETCPDEEKTTSPKVDVTNRLSIAQKIALFEKESSFVLKKSMSDEEKSKSLSRQSPAKAEALNHFLGTQITSQEPSDEEGKTNDSLSSDSESEEETSTAPPLPSNHPSQPSDESVIPSLTDKKVISDHKVISDTLVVTKELTHDEAIAKIAATESHDDVKNDIGSAHVVVNDSDKKLSTTTLDEFEMLFEQLAEEAVKDPINLSPKIDQTSVASKQSHPKPFANPVLLKPTNTEKELSEDVVEKEEIVLITEEIVVQTPESVAQLMISVENIPNIQVTETPSAETETIETVVETVTDTVKQESVDAVVAEEIKSAEETIVVKPSDVDYPDDLDPFGDEPESEEVSKSEPLKRPSLNPFGSCSEDEDDVEVPRKISTGYSGTLPKPPRPPLPKAMTLKSASTNPFGSDDEENEEPQKTSTSATRTPVPTPRKPFL